MDKMEHMDKMDMIEQMNMMDMIEHIHNLINHNISTKIIY